MGTHLFSRPPETSHSERARARTTSGKLFGKSVLGSPDGQDKYMTRYFFGSFRFHIMHRGDAGRGVHDHPWWFVTFPLNSYVEEVAYEEHTPIRDASGALVCYQADIRRRLNVVKRFRFHFRPAHYAHRILGPYDPIRKAVEAGAFIGRFYKPGQSLRNVKFMLDERGVPENKRAIKTLVWRGKRANGWGFYHESPPGKYTWIQHDQYFSYEDYDQ